MSSGFPEPGLSTEVFVLVLLRKRSFAFMETLKRSVRSRSFVEHGLDLGTSRNDSDMWHTSNSTFPHVSSIHVSTLPDVICSGRGAWGLSCTAEKAVRHL